MTWNIDDPSSIPRNIAKEAMDKGHVHRTSHGGVHVIVHYDEEREELDIYKLGKSITLARWNRINKGKK